MKKCGFLKHIKEIFTKNKLLKLFYLVLIAFLCYAPSFCQHAEITTPAQDTYYLNELAQGIETQEELIHFYKKYQEMEIAYSTRYNGATAIKFRAMTSDVFDLAGARREVFSQMEANEQMAEQTLTATLNDLDAAWQIEIASKEEALKHYNSILDDIVATHMAMRAKIIEAGKYYDEVAAAGYPQSMLDTHAAIVAESEALGQKLAEHHDRARHYGIAYDLKFGESFPKSLLLERYLDAFDGKCTRINEGDDYGDVEYVAELLGLISTQEELQRIETDVVEVISAAYDADGQHGRAIKFRGDLNEHWVAAEDYLYEVERLEYAIADFEYTISDKDAIWESISADRAAVEAPTESVDTAE